jgi:hypothetical protein
MRDSRFGWAYCCFSSCPPTSSRCSPWASLTRHGRPWWHSLPFLLVTLLLVGSPLIDLLLLGKRAEVLLPRVRDWMTNNSWVISEIVIVFFLALTISGLFS